MKTLITLLTALVLSTSAMADKPFKVLGDNKVYYSAFNSSFIDPKIASENNIVRGADRGLINIAVVPNDKESGGITALVKGTVTNIIQQSQKLDFFEVREGDVVYYLASFKFDHEDSLTFKIEVKADPNKPSETLTFRKTFYEDGK
ncbi:DUF4426 domain-containing protein [Porticoccaceae bacterium LTM1]|nr:DUF4426 domain-containing protein [Porticoccaceae bacterium LTM1]